MLASQPHHPQEAGVTFAHTGRSSSLTPRGISQGPPQRQAAWYSLWLPGMLVLGLPVPSPGSLRETRGASHSSLHPQPSH